MSGTSWGRVGGPHLLPLLLGIPGVQAVGGEEALSPVHELTRVLRPAEGRPGASGVATHHVVLPRAPFPFAVFGVHEVGGQVEGGDYGTEFTASSHTGAVGCLQAGEQ